MMERAGGTICALLLFSTSLVLEQASLLISQDAKDTPSQQSQHQS